MLLNTIVAVLLCGIAQAAVLKSPESGGSSRGLFQDPVEAAVEAINNNIDQVVQQLEQVELVAQRLQESLDDTVAAAEGVVDQQLKELESAAEQALVKAGAQATTLAQKNCIAQFRDQQLSLLTNLRKGIMDVCVQGTVKQVRDLVQDLLKQLRAARDLVMTTPDKMRKCVTGNAPLQAIACLAIEAANLPLTALRVVVAVARDVVKAEDMVLQLPGQLQTCVVGKALDAQTQLFDTLEGLGKCIVQNIG